MNGIKEEDEAQYYRGWDLSAKPRKCSKGTTRLITLCSRGGGEEDAGGKGGKPFLSKVGPGAGVRE